MSQGLFDRHVFTTRHAGLAVPMSLRPPMETRVEAEPDRSFEYALDALPVNAMFCDRELILRYLNRSSRKTLLSLQQYLPVPVDQIVGKSIHIFHKSPPNIDRILGARSIRGIHHLPHKATIPLGPVKLDLNVEPMTGSAASSSALCRLGRQHPGRPSMRCARRRRRSATTSST
jgi:hypothetical protein